MCLQQLDRKVTAMTKSVSAQDAVDLNATILKTTSATEHQTESLMQLLELTPEETNQVSGGLIHITILCVSMQ